MPHAQSHEIKERQHLLFAVKPHTPFTRSVERLMKKMRRGFLELPDMEQRLIELGIFGEEEEIDVLWAHMIYGDRLKMPARDRFMHTLWNPVLSALDTLNEKGMRALPQVRKNLMRCLMEKNMRPSPY
ncbi:MAG: hypothetical protein PHX87_00515 [Candidatus Peribacteraceae bacterium]|nr:hypothetical protein [Candidatus Peribacteraceae bacterium]MDD5741891.1 hypothetical protein [Candidatus Peribacteraceae bacterium]